MKILIVTAKLLTGFDAPICYCMYLDKPLRDHTLLQAICRTNRIYNETKHHGLIIDYLGIFENLAKALSSDPKEIEGMIDHLGKYKEQVPQAINQCIVFFQGVDRSIGGYEGLMAAQECINSNEMKDQFAKEFNILQKLWSALTPDKFLNPYQKDYKWLAQVYDSVRPVGGSGSLIWQEFGPETIRIIHENIEIDHIHNDLDTLIMNEEFIPLLTTAEQEERAKKIEKSLMEKVLKNLNNPRYIELGKRLEKLREKYQQGVLSSISWLKDLLDAARETVNLDKDTDQDNKIVQDNKTALKELFKSVRNDQTPIIISSIVEDIDKIVLKTRFDGWKDSRQGDREIKQVLRKTLLKYQLEKDLDLFDKAYDYIRENY